MTTTPDHDHDGYIADLGLEPDSPRWLDGPLVAIRNRASGSSSVYFGPFANLREFMEWHLGQNFGVELVRLVDPASDPDTWWS